MKKTADQQPGNSRRRFIKNTAIGLAGLYILPPQLHINPDDDAAGKTSPGCLTALQRLIAANTIGEICNIVFFPASCRNKYNVTLQPRLTKANKHHQQHLYCDQAITASWKPFVYYALQGMGNSIFKKIECSAKPLPNTKRFARTEAPPETAHLIFHGETPKSSDTLKFHWIEGDLRPLDPTSAVSPHLDLLEIEGSNGRISLFISEIDTRMVTAIRNDSVKPLVQTFRNSTNHSGTTHQDGMDIEATNQYSRLMRAAMVSKQTFCLLNSSGLSKFNYPSDYLSFSIDLDSNLIFRDEVCHQFLSKPA
ncbi:MAG: hypothetical protein JST32_08535 [Bacteroidetes bacterium]|nr:hypothetical protein [Bacteroidota bacterium]